MLYNMSISHHFLKLCPKVPCTRTKCVQSVEELNKTRICFMIDIHSKTLQNYHYTYVTTIMINHKNVNASSDMITIGQQINL